MVTSRTSPCSTLLTNSLNLTSSSGDCPWKVKRLNNRIMNRPTTTQKMRFFTREFILTPKNPVYPNIPTSGTQYAPTGDILRQFGQHLDLPRRLRASRVAGDHHEIHPEGKSDRPSQVRVEGEGALQNPDQDQVLLSVISRNLSSQFPDARPHLFLGDDGFAEDAFHAWRHYSFIPLPASVSRHGWSPARPETAHPPDTRPPRRCLPALPPAALRRGAFAEPSDPQRNPAASYDAPAGQMGRTSLPDASSARSTGHPAGPRPPRAQSDRRLGL